MRRTMLLMNRFIAWATKLPIPYWVISLLIGIAISISSYYVFQVNDAESAPRNWLPPYTYSLIFGFIPAYDLIILVSMSKRVTETLHEIRPVLDISKSEDGNLFNQNSYLAISGKSLWALSSLMFASVILALYFGGFFVYDNFNGYGVSGLIFFLLMLVPSFLVIFKMSKILWHVFMLQNQPLKINILDTNPLLSLSRLTQKLSIYLMPITTILGLLGVDMLLFYLEDITYHISFLEFVILVPLILVAPLFLSLSICVFILPVLWVRRLIIENKKQVLSDIAEKLLSSFLEHDRLIATGDLSNIDAITTSINALSTRNEIYKKVSEWPWEGRVLREFLSTLVIPIILWLAQFYLGHFFNG